jgi:hypothetical protein
MKLLGIFCTCLLQLIPMITNSSDPKGIQLKNIISIHVITPFDPYFPRVQAGYYYGLTRNWFAGIELGYGDYGLLKTEIRDNFVSLNYDYRLWEMRLEVKYIIRSRNNLKPYLSTEIFYIHHTETLIDYGYYDLNSSYFSYNEINYLPQKMRVKLKTGILVRVTDHFALEPYLGAGVTGERNIHPKSQKESDASQPWYPYFDEGIPMTWYVREYSGEGYNINLTIGVKIDILF